MGQRKAHPSNKGASVEVYAPDVLRALQPLAALLAPLLAPMVAREIHAKGGQNDTADPWIDQASSPLSRRDHCRACAAGKIEGARKVKRRWLARQSAIDAFIQVIGRAPRVEDAPASDVRDTDEPTAAEIAAKLRQAGLFLNAPRGAR